jgi:hypothetical protein
MLLGSAMFFGIAAAGSAQSNLADLGRAVGGQQVRLDMSSLQRVSDRSVDFLYYLGNDARYSQANCNAGSWTTFLDGSVHYPQSDTTARMVQIVCEEGLGTTQAPSTTRWVVFDPPSNVRDRPHGNIQCVVNSQRTINVYGSQGDWLITDTCGSQGFIHNSQVRSTR